MGSNCPLNTFVGVSRFGAGGVLLFNGNAWGGEEVSMNRAGRVLLINSVLHIL